ncbi:ATP-dependent RNA helicase HrpA [Tepidiphilus margaritifer]|uniref:ATP-dependent RNA helicase HrpA n=1 Tax=Tepidiphilus margaritifer TaxID=203471 RepID=UPI0004245D7D|nr:ATP-dependent RNA helicase HrpA [Tepidiphilus margaritifer]
MSNTLPVLVESAESFREAARLDLSRCLSQDRGPILALLKRLRRAKGEARERLVNQIAQRLERSQAAWEARRARRPAAPCVPDLPVSERAAELEAAIRAHRVVIVCGETGSGKTTQLPKICLAAGRGIAGQIAHTQPRRIAARATAERIAQELGSPLGRDVGYKVRFHDRTSPESYITLMTDGILLAETASDPWLSRYDTIIIDEAHERSLNIDFLLGYLHRLLARREDLKVVITSATMDAERFAAHFAPVAGDVPILEVSGRLYPIEIRYRPVEAIDGEDLAVLEGEEGDGKRAARAAAEERDLFDGIVACVEEAWREGPGDILVFLPGEREIREAKEALERRAAVRGEFEILPLFARQSAQEQARVFRRGALPRVVLATNVAETSLTVPGIRYVIDAGLARVKRYSPRQKVEQLRVERISQAAANQRAGRCGRVMDGVCFRLYTEEDFASRPAHTDPEILRSSLAGVILRMQALDLGEIEGFPFLDPPAPRAIEDGVRELVELSALDANTRTLTEVGRALAALPLDPKIGRLLVAGRQYGCLAEMLVLASALSVQDPRERPAEQLAQADQKHALFRGREREAQSEFHWYLNLWKTWRELERHESTNKQRQWCRAHFLSWLRMREWRDVWTQLHALVTEHGWRENEQPAGYEAVHKALIAGLVRHVGLKQEDASGPQAGSYLGAGGIRFWIHPSSPLAKRGPKWVLAAELVETTRLYARCVARIEPAWIEEVAPHLIRRQLEAPHWAKRAGEVRAWERGTLFGLPIYAQRAVPYRDVDPALCRTLFIREALVAGEVEPAALSRMKFLQHNLRLVEEIERLEQKTRRPDVLVDTALIEAFYDHLIPQDVVDLASFEAWRKQAERGAPKLLYLTREQLMRHEAAGVTTERFPSSFLLYGQPLALEYKHDPAAKDDGVTLVVPLALLNQVPAARCEWLVPGLLEDKVLRLLKTLPQKHRHRLQPLPEQAKAFCAAVEAGEIAADRPLLEALRAFVEARTQLPTPEAAFRPESLPPYCFMNFRVEGPDGRILAQGRSLTELRAQLGETVRSRFAELGGLLTAKAGDTGAPSSPNEGDTGVARAHGKRADPSSAAGMEGSRVPMPTKATSWEFGTLPELVEVEIDGVTAIGFPALEDVGDGVRLCACDTEEEAEAIHRRGVLRLLRFALKEAVRAIERHPDWRALAIAWMPYGNEAELREAVIEVSLARVCLEGELPRDAQAFAARVTAGKERLVLVAQELMRLLAQWLGERRAIEKRLEALRRAHPEVVADVEAQLAALFPPRFLATIPWERLQHYGRYLKAIGVRLDKLQKDPARDRQWLQSWRQVASPWERAWREAKGRPSAFLEEFRWLLEELRVGLFAQELKTPVPVSVKRLEKMWQAGVR